MDIEGSGYDLDDQVVEEEDVETEQPTTAENEGASKQPDTEAESGPAVPEDKIVNPTVAFGTVDATTTPTGVAKRIPPRKNTKVPLTVSGGSKGVGVEISVDGAGGGNGTASVNGRPKLTTAKSRNINVKGGTQTSPGKAGNLKLIAKVGATVVGTSNAFTVAAIPTTVRVTFAGLATGAKLGILMTTFNNSDSGKVADLDEVRMSELVKYQNGTGCFAGITSGNNSGYLPAHVRPHGVDRHRTPVALLTSVGKIESVQAFQFEDKRTGAVDIGVRNSGFMIVREVTQNKAKTKFYLTTHKYGSSTTVSGVSVSPGSGGAKKKQRV